MHSVLMDDACILKTHVFMQRWCDIAIVVFIIKSPHLAYSVDNRQHSTSATLNIGLNIAFSQHQNNRLNVTSAKLYVKQFFPTFFTPRAAEIVIETACRTSKLKAMAKIY